MAKLPFLYSGTIEFYPRGPIEALIDCIVSGLDQAGALTVDVKDNLLRFTSPFWTHSWNVLLPFSFGEILIDPKNRQIRYSLSLRRPVLLGVVVTALLTLVIVASKIWQPLIAMPFICSWLIGGNCVIGVLRFQMFINDSIALAAQRN